ncbi:MAG: sigma-70 family RNA polymerase sigma factor [Solirubrobacteraceae bacterium]
MAAATPPFQALLDAHGRDVRRFLAATAGPEAEDCWQETFLAALRAYPGLRSRENLRGWLFTIAHRKALDSHRARAARPVPVAAVPERAAASAPDVDAGEPELWARVRELPEKQRAAVVLRHVGDLPYDQIGRAMDTSPEAARRNVLEGLRRLREVWER